MPTKYIKCGFENRVIREDGFYPIRINGKTVGFNLDLRENYYRGLPLSTVHTLEVRVDGEKIPDSDMIADLNGKEFPVSKLRELYMEYWGIKTPLHLRVYGKVLSPGPHKVEVTLIHKSPYMAFSPGVYGQIDGSASKVMNLGEGREI